MHHLGLLSCPSDLHLWMKDMVRPDDGFNYYACVLIYMDDVIVIKNHADSVLRRIDKYFKLNPSSIVDPEIYLGSKLKKTTLENKVQARSKIPSIYVKESVAKVEKYFSELFTARW